MKFGARVSAAMMTQQILGVVLAPQAGSLPGPVNLAPGTSEVDPASSVHDGSRNRDLQIDRAGLARQGNWGSFDTVTLGT